MPSYRYLRDIEPENPRPEEARVYTKREKMANWWHYHWYFVVGGAALLAVLVFFISDILSAKKPDYTIAVLSPYHLPQQVADGMEQGLQAAAGDVNDDGEVLVQVDVWNLSAGDETTGPHDGVLVMAGAEEVMAGVTKLQSALVTGDTALFICDPAYLDAFQEGYGMYGDETGNIPAQGRDPMAYTVAWADVPLLRQLDFGEDTAALQDFLKDWRVGLRPYYGTTLDGNEKAFAHWRQQQAFFEEMRAA